MSVQENQPPAGGSPLLTDVEAAKYLRLSVSTLRRYARAGRIARVRLGHAVRYQRAELDRIVREGF